MPDADITAAVNEARALLLSDFRPDTYQVVKQQYTDDGTGGQVGPVESVVASGVCTLRIAGQGGAGQAGQERAIAEKMGWTTAYAVDLDPDVQVDPAHELRVNGRTMTIGGVARGGEWDVEQTIVCQERG